MAKQSSSRKKAPTERRTGEIVLCAIKKLMKNTGWTQRTIVKFIKLQYGITDNKLGRKVSRALKTGVKLGLLMVDHGRYRLHNISSVIRTDSSHLRAKRTHHENRGFRIYSPERQASPRRR